MLSLMYLCLFSPHEEKSRAQVEHQILSILRGTPYLFNVGTNMQQEKLE